MSMTIVSDAIDHVSLRTALADPTCGALVTFEGWVRNHDDGRDVLRLEYEIYAPLSVTEGEKILNEAREKFPIENALCVHRAGTLEIGDVAVWVGVSSHHRDEAFQACRYIIDQIKVRLPIWKKEHYVSGDSEWVNCQRCAEHGHAHSDHTEECGSG